MKVEINIPGLERAIANLTDMDMARIGFKAQELNSDQVDKGFDAKGKKFKPYTPEYAKKKGVSAGDVDLVSNARVRPKGGINQTGHMMTEFGFIKATKTTAVVGWLTPQNKLKAKGNFYHRKFVGLGPARQRALAKYVASLILKK